MSFLSKVIKIICLKVHYYYDLKLLMQNSLRALVRSKNTIMQPSADTPYNALNNSQVQFRKV